MSENHLRLPANMPPKPPTAAVAVSRAAPTLDPPGWLALGGAAPLRLGEAPVLTERMVQGEAAPSSEADAEQRRRALQAKGMQLAQAQGMQLVQVGFMLYFMIGSRLNLWSIFYLVLMGTAPFKNLFGVQAAFAPLAAPGVDLGAAKLLYAVINLAGCGFFFYKLHSMGLMPITSSDWVSLLPVRTQSDYSSLGLLAA